MEQTTQRVEGTGKLSLVRKLAEVMGAVERVAKSGRNEFHKYDYATEADIVASVRVAMSDRALMLVPDVVDMKLTEIPRKNGGNDRLVTLKVKFTVHDGDSGERLSFDVFGEGQDTGDKATYKAMTGATKYALLKLFLIPTGDDPEQDEPPQKGRGQQGQQAPPPRQQQPQGERRTQPAQAPREARPAGPVAGAADALVAHGGDVIGYGRWVGVRLSTATVEQVRECVEFGKAELAGDKPVHNADLVRATLTVLAKWLVAKQATPREEPVAVFGPLKGRKLADLTDGELAGVYDLGQQKLQAPKASAESWYSAAKKGVADVEAEIQLRERRKEAFDKAMREPGARADHGDQ